MRGFIDGTGKAAKRDEPSGPAKRPIGRKQRSVSRQLWPALIAGTVGIATMIVAGIGGSAGTNEAGGEPVKLTIATPACIADPGACYGIDRLTKFETELSEKLRTASTPDAERTSVTIEMPREGGLVPAPQ